MPQVITRKQSPGDDCAYPTSFQELFRTYYPAVVRQLYYLLGEKSAAEDLAQETFLRLYTSPPREWQNPGGWLARVATNLAYSYLRAEKSRQARENRLLDTAEDKIVSIDDLFMRQQEVRQVRSALQQLTARDRLCLLLKFSGYSYREIAHALAIRPGSVGTILARALERFRKEYQRQRGSDHVL